MHLLDTTDLKAAYNVLLECFHSVLFVSQRHQDMHPSSQHRFDELKAVTPAWEAVTAAIDADAQAVKVLGKA